MHGTLRFILAITVALSHLGVTLYGYNPGVVAVVIFYLLAGMVAYKLTTRVYINQPIHYYKDRVKRIFPLYFLALLFSYSVYLLGASSYFISAKPDFFSFISNLTVVPLSYYMYNGSDTFTLLPPVWSLGVELQFYLLAPFILLKFKNILLFFIPSFLIYTLAVLGYLNTDYFAYRLIFGVLFIFLLGSLIQKSIKNHQKSIYFLIATYLILLLIFIYLQTISYNVPYNTETLFGLLIGIPLLYFLKFKVSKTLDNSFGTLSYPIFLLHFPTLWFSEFLFNVTISKYLILLFTMLLSLLFLYLLSYFENRFLK